MLRIRNSGTSPGIHYPADCTRSLIVHLVFHLALVFGATSYKTNDLLVYPWFQFSSLIWYRHFRSRRPISRRQLCLPIQRRRPLFNARTSPPTSNSRRDSHIPAAMARHISLMVIMAIAAFLGISFMMSFGGSSSSAPSTLLDESKYLATDNSVDSSVADLGSVSNDLLTGDVIAPKLENATLKYAVSPFGFSYKPPQSSTVVLTRY